LSVKSDWVRDEADRAHESGRVLSVRIDRVSPPMGFGQVQTADLSSWNGAPADEQFAELTRAIEQRVERRIAPITAAPAVVTAVPAAPTDLEEAAVAPAAVRATDDRQVPSPAIYRMLCGSGWREYAELAAIGLLPLLTALLVGVHRTVMIGGVEYKGYWAKTNWIHWPVTLPLILFAVRRLVRPLVPTEGRKDPSLIECFEPEAQDEASYVLSRSVLALVNYRVGIALTVLISIVDAHAVLWAFVCRWQGWPVAAERDWSILAAVDVRMMMLPNLLHDLLAYGAQATAILMAMLLLIVFVRHNWFLLMHVYQFRTHGPNASGLVVDLDDPQECFGLRAAHRAFNVQVAVLLVAGPLLLVTRFANVTEQTKLLDSLIPAVAKTFKGEFADLTALSNQLSLATLLPDVGQVMVMVGWSAACLIVCMPMLVKFLPRLRRPRVRAELVPFLEEFLPNSRLPWTRESDVDKPLAFEWAHKFASNSFWPTGDQPAWWLFFWSFFVGIWILFPIEPRSVGALVGLVPIGVLAAAITVLLFKALRWSLAVIHPQLVKAARDDE
jgi:hypothetical protein